MWVQERGFCPSWPRELELRILRGWVAAFHAERAAAKAFLAQ
jgi:hypothetical protein